MYKPLIAHALLVLFGARLPAQPPRIPCSCSTLLDESIDKVTTIYAGFDDKITPRTRPRYRQLLAQLRREAPWVTTERGCYDVIQRYADFFRDNHVGAWFGVKSSPAQQRFVPLPETPAFVSSTRMAPAGLEGVWATADDRQRYAITKDPGRRDELVAVTLATADPAWLPGMVKAEFYRYEPRLGFYRGMYYRPDFSGVLNGFTLHANRIDHWFGPSWYRQSGATAPGPVNDGPTPDVQFRVLNAQFAYVKFARFDQPNVRTLDSLLATHRAVLAETPNLIVDLRGNPGGGASSSDAMIRLIYTNPIVYPAWQYRSSPELITSTREYLATLRREPSTNGWIIERQQQLLARLLAHPGQLVRGGGDVTRTVDSVAQLPNRVAFLTDGRTGSSAEFFVFEGKQSRKVTTFGRNTAGVMDYGEDQTFKLSCGQYTIAVPWGRNGWIERFGYRIDNVGFRPDVQIPSGEPDPVAFIVRRWSNCRALADGVDVHRVAFDVKRASGSCLTRGT